MNHSDIPESSRGDCTFASVSVDGNVQGYWKRTSLFNEEECKQDALRLHDMAMSREKGNRLEPIVAIQTVIEGLSMDACVRLSLELRMQQIDATRQMLMQLLGDAAQN